ncbi:hypothetical protein [Delftia tsuruhatensis]|uniref:hypothetical protein n=2 Tax=Comamonadaceae TaxID=80864 RepID=UPI001C31B971|nr:hypothetical protein [Delftia tsuruhatensis]
MISGTTSAGEKNSPPIQDLQEIKRSADEFLMKEKRQKRTQLTAVRINPKIIVEQCAATLETNWASPGSGVLGKRVQVVCKSTLHDKRGWRFLVPVAASDTHRS